MVAGIKRAAAFSSDFTDSRVAAMRSFTDVLGLHFGVKESEQVLAAKRQTRIAECLGRQLIQHRRLFFGVALPNGL